MNQNFKLSTRRIILKKLTQSLDWFAKVFLYFVIALISAFKLLQLIQIHFNITLWQRSVDTVCDDNIVTFSPFKMFKNELIGYN